MLTFKLAILMGLVISDQDLFTTVLTLEDNNTAGMEAISEVVWNRSGRRPESVRKVLLRRYQFSCLNSHTLKGKALIDLVRKARSRPNWNEASQIVANVYAGKVTNRVGNSRHYHVYRGKYKVTPSWTHPTLGGTNPKARIVTYVGDHAYLMNVDK